MLELVGDGPEQGQKAGDKAGSGAVTKPERGWQSRRLALSYPGPLLSPGPTGVGVGLPEAAFNQQVLLLTMSQDGDSA